ncbi:MAG: RtcB family protein, partial [Planctomycetota bacterium]
MKLIKNKQKTKLPIKSWCADVDEGAMDQAINLANHPTLAMHVALMPDCHVGYGMPIGGVIASKDAVIPNAV